MREESGQDFNGSCVSYLLFFRLMLGLDHPVKNMGTFISRVEHRIFQVHGLGVFLYMLGST